MMNWEKKYQLTSLYIVDAPNRRSTDSLQGIPVGPVESGNFYTWEAAGKEGKLS